MRVFLALLLTMIPWIADAKTLYVNPGHGSASDATTYANNSASLPWSTIERAVWGSTNYAATVSGEAAAAGDTVLITAGTYTVTSGSAAGGRWDVILNPVNSGTAGNVITFRGVGLVYVRISTAIRGPMIGCYSKNYVTWDHFQIDDFYGGSKNDTGPVVFNLSTGCQIINSDVMGHSGSFQNGDALWTNNYNAIRCENSSDLRIYNNVIHRVWGVGTTVGSSGQNDAGVMTYSCQSTIIEHNEFYDVGEGVSIKGITSTAQDNVRIRFNYLHDNLSALRVMFGKDAWVYQNLVINSKSSAFWIGINLGGVAENEQGRWFNNTIVEGATNGLYYASVQSAGSSMVGVQVKNNISTGTAGSVVGSFIANTPNDSDVAFDYNWYDYSTSPQQFADYVAGRFNYATWQGTYSKDTNSSNAVSPQFVGSGSYKLQGGSPALTAGRVNAELVTLYGLTLNATIPAGAYITGNEVIGVEGASTASTTISGTVTFSGSVRIQ